MQWNKTSSCKQVVFKAVGCHGNGKVGDFLLQFAVSYWTKPDE
jgi:hypothetical protein